MIDESDVAYFRQADMLFIRYSDVVSYGAYRHGLAVLLGNVIWPSPKMHEIAFDGQADML